MGIDDEDFPLADHPGPGGLKAGDREMNRERDMIHLDAKQPLQPTRVFASPNPANTPPNIDQQPAMLLPETAPVMIAWRAFQQTDGYAAKGEFSMFLAGWTARDSQPKET